MVEDPTDEKEVIVACCSKMKIFQEYFKMEK